jgi:hypothetical protein
MKCFRTPKLLERALWEKGEPTNSSRLCLRGSSRTCPGLAVSWSKTKTISISPSSPSMSSPEKPKLKDEVIVAEAKRILNRKGREKCCPTNEET